LDVPSRSRCQPFPRAERLLKEGQVFSGDTEVVVRPDQFLVDGMLSRGRGS
jgi:hypothetical protein